MLSTDCSQAVPHAGGRWETKPGSAPAFKELRATKRETTEELGVKEKTEALWPRPTLGCFWRRDPPGGGRPVLSLGDVPKEILLSPKMRLQRGVPPALQSGSILWSEHVAAQGDRCEGETPALGG